MRGRETFSERAVKLIESGAAAEGLRNRLLNGDSYGELMEDSVVITLG